MSKRDPIHPVVFANKEFFNSLVRSVNIGWLGIFAGQACRYLKDSSGELIVPQFFRHHLSNIFDGAVLAGVIDELQMAAQLRKNIKDGVIKPLNSRPILSATFALVAGVGFEAATAMMPNRHFDVVDTSMHAASAGAYAIFGMRRKKQFEKKTKDLVPEVQ